VTGNFIGFGPCFLCGRNFVFDPDLVPSVPIDPETDMPPDVEPKAGGAERAVKQPLCAQCVARVNVERKGQGREAIHVLPGAYPDAD